MNSSDLIRNLQIMYGQLDQIEVRGRLNHAALVGVMNMIEEMAKKLSEQEGESSDADIHA